MKAEGRPFKGVIFFGLMLTEEGPKVLEYNARFGDPEAQVVLPRMKNDILEVVEACIDGTLDKVDLQFEDNAAVCVVLASEGYPVSYEKGLPIEGLEEFMQQITQNYTVTLDKLSVNEKLKLLSSLKEKGFFNIRGSVSTVAKYFDCSQSSIYRYLSKLSS